MRAYLVLAALFGVVMASSPALAQMTLDEARQEGKALGTEKRNDSTLVPSSDAQAAAVPGYSGTSLPEGSYFDDPGKLESDAQAAKSSNEQYRITTDADHSRATFSNSEILATTARATSVENDPSTYLAGEEMGGTKGTCVPLPAAPGSAGYYEASCNAGSKVTTEARTCNVSLDVHTEKRTIYTYYTGRLSFLPTDGGPYPARAAFDDEIATGICWESRPIDYCDNMSAYGYTAAPTCKSLGHTAVEVKCTAEAQGITPGEYHPGYVLSTGNYWLTKQEEPAVPVITRNEGLCAANAGDPNCTLETEVCTSSDPVTRIVDGVPVTQPCWAWQRTYQCHRISTANDCGDLEANGSCTYLRTECLDEEPDGGPCKVENRVYRCPTPSGGTSDAPQYICGDDVYCINGDCEPIEREASTEFKDALVGLHTLGQANQEFNETTMTLFSGTRETCTHKLFGISNCCSGKGVPLLTPFVCSAAERELDKKDDKGLCHRVGSYCSDKILGICVTSKDAYCCFESKLSRILQEQGRVQIGKAWAKPKDETCKGFTLAEFQMLDLSVMDFSEVYAEFIDAAKLPNELETTTQIQERIEAYLQANGNK